MTIGNIRLEQRFNLGDYESELIACDVQLLENESPEAAAERGFNFIQGVHQSNDEKRTRVKEVHWKIEDVRQTLYGLRNTRDRALQDIEKLLAAAEVPLEDVSGLESVRSELERFRAERLTREEEQRKMNERWNRQYPIVEEDDHDDDDWDDGEAY